jgi:hypothetical protein
VRRHSGECRFNVWSEQSIATPRPKELDKRLIDLTIGFVEAVHDHVPSRLHRRRVS